MFFHTLSQLGINDGENTKINVFSESHQDHITVALRMFKDNVVFGKGPNVTKSLFK